MTMTLYGTGLTTFTTKRKVSPCPQIYVACLASYNAGKLHGVWIDIEGLDEDDILEEIGEMLKKSPEPIAEDWRIDDFEGFYGWNPSKETLETIAEVGNAIAEADEEKAEALAIYLNEYNGDFDKFSDRYCGKFDSEADFVEERFADDGTLDAAEQIGLSVSYIDFEQIATDWFCGSYCSYKGKGSGVFVFHNE